MSKRARSESWDARLHAHLEKKRRLDARRHPSGPFADFPIELRLKIWTLLPDEPSDMWSLILTCFCFYEDAHLLIELPPMFRGPYELPKEGGKLVSDLWRHGLVHWPGVERLSMYLGPSTYSPPGMLFNLEHPRGYVARNTDANGVIFQIEHGIGLNIGYNEGTYTLAGMLLAPHLNDADLAIQIQRTIRLPRGPSLGTYLSTPCEKPIDEDRRHDLVSMLDYLQSVAEKLALE